MDRNSKIVAEQYLDFVRAKACCACGAPAPSDPDHVKARGGGSGKQNDFTAVPLCRGCHSVRHAMTIPQFNQRYRIDLWEEATMLLIEFLVYLEPLVRGPVHYSVGKTERAL